MASLPVSRWPFRSRTETLSFEDERTGVDVFQGVDIHDWEIGGRR
jgi:hypothetical protein